MLGFSSFAEAPFGALPDRVIPIFAAFVGEATVTGSLATQYRVQTPFSGTAALTPFAGRQAVVETAFTGSAEFEVNARLIGAAVSFSFGSAVMVSEGRRIRGVRTAMLGRSLMTPYAVSAFEDLIENPNRRLVYTIEISPWLLTPYEEAA